LLLTFPTLAADWPQWMGPTRDGVWAEPGVLTKFPAGGPKKLWAVPIHGGYSGPAVVGGKVFVTDYARATGDATNNPAKRSESKGQERILCLDAKTGKELWKYPYDCPYSVSYPAGPRCTPTVSGGKVYALGAMGNLVCLDAANGSVVWQKDFKTDYQAKTPIWGFSGHPLVVENLLICLVGGDGSVAVAFDKDTGKEVWKALSAPEPGYCPPTVVTVAGQPRVAIFHAKGLQLLDPRTGAKVWPAAVPLEPSYGMSIAAPLQHGDLLYVGAYRSKAVALKLNGTAAPAELYRAKRGSGLYPVNATPVVTDGILYGSDEDGSFRAVELATGKRLWGTFRPAVGEEKDADFRGANDGTVFTVRNGDRYFLFAETGHLIVAKLTPEKYEEVSRAKLVEPTGEAFGRRVVWTHPAFADRCVFVRNDKEIACFSLAE
jgi:outer membrane protein assembly factor BamB